MKHENESILEPNEFYFMTLPKKKETFQLGENKPARNRSE